MMNSEEKEQDKPVLPEIQCAIDKLYEFRNNFFLTHPASDAIKKPELLRKELKDVMDLIEQYANMLNKSSYYLCIGQASSVLPDFDSVAFEALSKAVKLDPSSVEAWNLLGECFWKKGDVQSARNCFTDALKWKTNKVILF